MIRELDNLLSAFDRKARLLLAVGDCAVDPEADCGEARAVTEADVARFAALLRAGRSLRAIARETGFAYSTVVQHTRAMRRTS